MWLERLEGLNLNPAEGRADGRTLGGTFRADAARLLHVGLLLRERARPGAVLSSSQDVCSALLAAGCCLMNIYARLLPVGKKVGY